MQLDSFCLAEELSEKDEDKAAEQDVRGKYRQCPRRELGTFDRQLVSGTPWVNRGYECFVYTLIDAYTQTQEKLRITISKYTCAFDLV